MGVPLTGWFSSGKILLKWMIWRYLYFRKPPYEWDMNEILMGCEWDVNGAFVLYNGTICMDVNIYIYIYIFINMFIDVNGSMMECERDMDGITE